MEEDVVHDGPRRRQELDGSHPSILVQAQRNQEVTVDVGPAGGHFERVLHLHDEVRLAELIARGIRRWVELARTVGHTPFHPPHQGGDLGVGEAPLVLVPGSVGGRVPRRHEPILDDVRHHRAPLLDVPVGQQGEGRSLTRTMAVAAGPMDQGADLPGPTRQWEGQFLGGRRSQKRSQERRNQA